MADVKSARDRPPNHHRHVILLSYLPLRSDPVPQRKTSETSMRNRLKQ